MSYTTGVAQTGQAAGVVPLPEPARAESATAYAQAAQAADVVLARTIMVTPPLWFGGPHAAQAGYAVIGIDPRDVPAPPVPRLLSRTIVPPPAERPPPLHGDAGG